MIGSKKTIIDPNAEGVPRDSIWGMAPGIAVRVGSLMISDKLLILPSGTAGLTVGMKVLSSSINDRILLSNSAGITISDFAGANTVILSGAPAGDSPSHSIIFIRPEAELPASTNEVVYRRAVSSYSSFGVTLPSGTQNIVPGMLVCGYGVPDFTTVTAVEAKSNSVTLSGWIRHEGLEANNLLVFVRPLNQPEAIASDEVGALYIADTGNNRILRFYPKALTFKDLSDLTLKQVPAGTVEVLTPVSGAPLSAPRGITVVSYGPTAVVYVANSSQNTVLKIARSGHRG
jgi:hypothetical protein